MSEEGRLLREFPAPAPDAWRHEVERLLKGAPFSARMVTTLPEGVTVAPMATAADVAEVPWWDTLPGAAPFVRGPRAAGYHATPWWVAQEHRYATCEEFNNAVREGLQRGQTAVRLVLDAAGMAGLDPDQVGEDDDRVGRDGTSVCSLSDLAVALDGVDLAAVPVQIEAGAAAMPLAAMFVALARRRQVDAASLRGCLGSDPWAGLAGHGRLDAVPDRLQDELAVLARWAAGHAPGLRTLPVYEDPWHDGGADLALSLGLTLAAGVATLRAMDERGIAPEEAAPRFQFNLSLGTDFFLEIAKLRALRPLWSRILGAAGVPREATATFVHARTARRAATSLDPHVNLLRATTGAMSGVMGGADSIHVSPFDAVGGRPDGFSRRLARNIQLILAHECHFDRVGDPAGGAWHVEKLTWDLAQAAWARFQDVEREGGLAAALDSGWVQSAVGRAAEARAQDLATRRQVMIGVNAYPDPKWRPGPAGADGDPGRRRREALARDRDAGTRESHLAVLSRLEKVMEGDADELFANLVAAAEAGATLGEFVGISRGAAPPALAVAPVPVRRDAAPFEALRTRFAALGPDRTTVHALCLGDFARYMARLDFARGVFAVAGCPVVGDAWHASADAALAAARAHGAPAVVLVGLDETYAAQAAAVAAGLKGGPDAPVVFLAGAPGEHEDDWRRAGVDVFLTRHSDVLAVLGDLAASLEERA